MRYSQIVAQATVKREIKRNEFNSKFLSGELTLWDKIMHPVRYFKEKNTIVMSNIMAHAQDMISIVDTRGITRQLSESYTKVLGYDLSDLVGKSAFDLLHQDDMDKAKEVFARGLQNGGSEIMELRIMNKDGNYIWVETSGSPIRDGDKIIGVVLVNRDITEFKKNQKQLESSEKERSENSEKMARLLSIIIHDVGNKLNSIYGFSEMIVQEKANIKFETVMQYCQIIFNSTSAANDIIKNVIRWRNANNIISNPVNMDIFTLVDDITSSTILIAGNKELNVVNGIERGKYIVYADESMASQIIQNLVANAVKFTPRGGSVKISAKTREDGFVEVSVSDTGVGMSQLSINRLFKIEETFTTKGTEGEEGTGLGLTIVKELVEKSGGKVWVESTQGKGTTFTFTLPCTKAT